MLASTNTSRNTALPRWQKTKDTTSCVAMLMPRPALTAAPEPRKCVQGADSVTACALAPRA
jgi:hypothetical protein